MTFSTDFVPNLAARETFPEDTVIEIQMWEAHATDRHGVRARFLSKHSLDGRPILPEKFTARRVTYRFKAAAWLGEIKLFLIQNRIPVSVSFVKTDHQNLHHQTDQTLNKNYKH